MVEFSKDVKTSSEAVLLNILACNIPPQTTENITFTLLLFNAHIKSGYQLLKEGSLNKKIKNLKQDSWLMLIDYKHNFLFLQILLWFINTEVSRENKLC